MTAGIGPALAGPGPDTGLAGSPARADEVSGWLLTLSVKTTNLLGRSSEAASRACQSQ